MNKAESPSPSRRRYQSEARANQKSQTRRRILDTLVAKLADGSFDALAMDQIAVAAGVAPATLYRYFPNRESLLDGVVSYFNEVVGGPTYPLTPDEVVADIRRTFPTFDRHADLIRSFFLSELGRRSRSRGRPRRIAAIRSALRPITERLPEPRRTEVEAVIAYLNSLQAWLTMTQEFGLTGTQVGNAVIWAIKTLLANLPSSTDNDQETRIDAKGDLDDPR